MPSLDCLAIDQTWQCDMWLYSTLCLSPCRYTAVKGFAKAVLETNDLAGQRELVAEYIEAEVCPSP